MGAPEGVEGGIGVDCSVGTIVWVRRRNGSWWPGRILGQEELSASHLMSPRSGTPVKLLGREDASVDWYNLEKSKRVKAFRCGEFDACIERAEASQGVLSKKREKYARREDAILHALELEKQQTSGVDTNSLSHKHSGGSKRELNSHSSSELHLRDDESKTLVKSVNSMPQSHRNIDLLSEEVSESRPLNSWKCESGKQMDWEEDNSEALPRMRGLQDLGLCIVPSKKKGSSSIACESSMAALVNNYGDVIPDSDRSVGHVNDAGSSKNSVVDKRKRSYGGLMEEYFVKKRDRRRPLVQVLQNSAKLPAIQSLQADCETVPILGQEENEHVGTICRVNRSRCTCLTTDSSDCLDHTGGSSDQMQLSPTQVGCSSGLHYAGSLSMSEEGTSSGLIKEEETCSSEKELVDAGMEDDTALLQEYTSIVPVPINSERHVWQGVSTLGDKEKLGKICNGFGTSISGCKAVILSNDKAAGTGDMGVSKWHMKGKRNSRNLTKRHMEVLDGKSSLMSSDNCNGYLSGLVYKKKKKKRGISKMSNESISGQGFYKKAREPNYTYDDDDNEFFEKDLKNRLIGCGKHSYPSMTKAASREDPFYSVTRSDDDSHEIFSSGWQDDNPHLALRPYWAESDECMDPPFVHPLNVEMKPLLFDVNLKVQASYHGEHVPLVSLMSRLNGKAIVGHPIHIEILEDGFTNLMFPKNVEGLDTTDVVEHAGPPHVWRTGRRTAMQRVPRPHLAPSAPEGDTELIPCSDRENRLFKKPYASTHQASSVEVSFHQRWPTSGKSHKRLSREGSLSNQKTRKLSSISVEQKRNNMNISAKQRRNRGVLDGLIKPGGVVPLVTCVPVKVVFSRLLEAVGRPPSAGVTCRGPLSCSSVRNPS